MGLADELQQLAERISSLQEQLQTAQAATRPLVEQLEGGLQRVAASWSGSFAGYHALLYFRDFQRAAYHESFSPEWGGIDGVPEGWREREPEEVRRAIEAPSGGTIATVAKAAEPIATALNALRDDVAVSLAPIRQVPALATEAKMLDAVEKMAFRVPLHEYLNANMGGIRTRDSHAASQGIRIPSHLYYEAELAQATTVFGKGDAFLRAASRIVRQVRSQQSFLAVREVTMSDALSRIVHLAERFHRVVARLRTRHDGRPPFAVKDEYDVQDLFDALLQTDFEDVRREERSPSYAGSAPSIDFVLKAERLGIEVKMARASMTAKTLGDELLADIGRYAAHPDCRTLVCFVYDPEARLKNPRGVERDLQACSSDRLRVVVLIAPR